MKKINLIFVIVFLTIVFVTIFFLTYLNKPSKIYTQALRPTPIPLPNNLDTNYSNLNYLIPGKSNLEDVKKINGYPKSTSVFGNEMRLYYPTPFKGFDNVVFLRNGVVVYALEHVFAGYRGTYQTYVQKYGNPDLVMYDKNPQSFPWYVFLKSGIAVQSTNNFITGIIYFIPQEKNSFIYGTGEDLNLSILQTSGRTGAIAPL